MKASDFTGLVAVRHRLGTVWTAWRNETARVVEENPELFFPLCTIFVWNVTAAAVQPQILAVAVVFAPLLIVYGYSVLGKSDWLRRLGWVSPRRGFWLGSVAAGLLSACAVALAARVAHVSLGAPPRPHTVLLAASSGAILEELLFRGLLFWLAAEMFQRLRLPGRWPDAAAVAVIAVLFAAGHFGRTGVGLYSTVFTGIAFGVMRLGSGSTAAAALMHGIYNLVISWMSLIER